VLTGDPDPRNRPRIGAAAVRDHIPGAATARNVHTADQRIVVEILRFALLRFQDAGAVDELELVGRRWKPSDANEFAILAVGGDSLDQFFVRYPENVLASDMADLFGRRKVVPTTGLYYRRNDDISVGEVERIGI
jgi:hypothetical protein